MHNIYHLKNNPCITTEDIEELFKFNWVEEKNKNKKNNNYQKDPTTDNKPQANDFSDLFSSSGCSDSDQKLDNLKKEKDLDCFNWLPDEIVLEILQYIDQPFLLCYCSCVSKRFNNISSDPVLWNPLLKKYSRSIDYIRCYLGMQSTFGTVLHQDIVFKGVAGITKYYHNLEKKQNKKKKKLQSKQIEYKKHQGIIANNDDDQNNKFQNNNNGIKKSNNNNLFTQSSENEFSDYTDPEDIKFFEKISLLKSHPENNINTNYKKNYSFSNTNKFNKIQKKKHTIGVQNSNSILFNNNNAEDENNNKNNVNLENKQFDHHSNSSSSSSSSSSRSSSSSSSSGNYNNTTTNNNNAGYSDSRKRMDNELRELSDSEDDFLLQEEVELLPEFQSCVKTDPKIIFITQLEKVQKVWKLREQTKKAFFQDEQKRKVAKGCLMFTGFRRQVFFLGLFGLMSSIFLLRKMIEKIDISFLACLSPMIVWSILYLVFSFAQALYGKLDMAQFKLARGNFLTSSAFVVLFILFPLKLDGADFSWMLLVIPSGIMSVSACVTAHHFKDKKNYPGSWDINYFLGLLVSISLFHFVFIVFFTIKMEKIWDFSYGFIFMWLFLADFSPLFGISLWPFLVILFDKNIKHGFRQVFHETSEDDDSKRFSLIVMFSLILFFVFCCFFLVELLIYLKINFLLSFSWAYCFIPLLILFSLLLCVSCLYESSKFLVYVSEQL
ncbi:f-box only protein [Anaeramoeba flamelloides]|uniref:F-box only protein n=1 Tax=Anaeramoeba flamelloides TaxID=1746091 RepID=A0ABQ8Y8J5_9EUKA|nr:f-box only protein [Anaeramoeba flamelloides]